MTDDRDTQTDQLATKDDAEQRPTVEEIRRMGWPATEMLGLQHYGRDLTEDRWEARTV